MPTERYVFCEYCDDIRQEMFGKLSLIGVYQNTMNIIGVLPIIVPKFFISAHIVTPKDKPFLNAKIDLKVNDTIIESITPSSETLMEGQNDALRNPDVRLLSLRVVIALQPFEVTQSGRLRVQITADGEEFESNGLIITIHPDPSHLQSQMGWLHRSDPPSGP